MYFQVKNALLYHFIGIETNSIFHILYNSNYIVKSLSILNVVKLLVIYFFILITQTNSIYEIAIFPFAFPFVVMYTFSKRN